MTFEESQNDVKDLKQYRHEVSDQAVKVREVESKEFSNIEKDQEGLAMRNGRKSGKGKSED